MIEVPNTVNLIGDAVFQNCAKLISFRIPSNVKVINNNLFFGCSGLTSIEIPETIKSIGYHAFDNCSGLTSMEIPNSVTAIGPGAFYRCSGLASINIPTSLTEIESSTFSGCSGLSSIEIPGSVTSIGNSAFANCAGLISVEIPNSVTSIGREVFGSCTALASVTVPHAINSIPEKAFWNSLNLKSAKFEDGLNPLEIEAEQFEGLTELYWGRPLESLNFSCADLESLTIGNSPEIIPDSKFSGLSKLEKLTLGASLKEIGASAFKDCNRLSEVVLSPQVEIIGDSAFENNENLKTIIIGSKIQEIGEHAFYGYKLDNIYITAQTPPSASNTTFSDYTGKLWLNDEKAVAAYYDAFTCWDRFTGYPMVAPTKFVSANSPTISGNAGETIQLKASLMPENVTLPQVFWRSTNPDVATVDQNGLVTLLKGDTSTVIPGRDSNCSNSVKIIASSLYPGVADLEFMVNCDTNEVYQIVTDFTDGGSIDFSGPMEIYSISGVKVSDRVDALAKGIYIIRQGSVAKKIYVN